MKDPSPRKSTVALAAVMISLASSTYANVVLDQENDVLTASPIGSGWTRSELLQLTEGKFTEYIQTFTVGVAGTLTRLEVEMYHDTDTRAAGRVRLWGTTAAGLPDPTRLLSTWYIDDTNSGSVIGGFVPLALGVDAFVVSPGEIYAIAFSPDGLTEGGSDRYWIANTTGVGGTTDWYAAGTALYRDVDTVGNGLSDFVPAASAISDYGFRTFVNVPEPTTLALFGLGLAGLGAVRGKKLAA